MLGREILKRKIRGYSLIESVTAIVILTLSIMLSTSLITSPILGTSHRTLIDAEQIADSLNAAILRLELPDDAIINRPWGVCILRQKELENKSVRLFEIYARTNFGNQLTLRKGFYAY